MRGSCSAWLLSAVVTVLLTSSSNGSKLTRYTGKPVSSMLVLNASCSMEWLEARIVMSSSFNGAVYARGFPLECRTQGNGTSDVMLRLPAGRCGVRMEPQDDGSMMLSAPLAIQMDKVLQLITDEHTDAKCKVPHNQLSRPGTRSGFRTGRKQIDSSSQETSGVSEIMAWMEIMGDKTKSQTPGKVTVGEPTTLSIHAHIPDGFSFRVGECAAHDGSGDSNSQRLLDGRGCPLDPLILPALQAASSEDRISKLVTRFSAFKFPDRDSLHIRCTLHICRQRCLPIDCNDDHVKNERSRKLKGKAGEVVDHVQVYNSVEVFAPGIEIDRPDKFRSPDYSSEDDWLNDRPASSGSLPGFPGDRSFCLSPPRMAIAFCILGLIFLVAVAVAFYSLMRGRKSSGSRRRGFFLRDELLIVQDNTPGANPMVGFGRQAWPRIGLH